MGSILVEEACVLSVLVVARFSSTAYLVLASVSAAGSVDTICTKDDILSEGDQSAYLNEPLNAW